MIYRHWNNSRVDEFALNNAGLVASFPLAVVSCIDGDPEVAKLGVFDSAGSHNCLKYVCLSGAELLAAARGGRVFSGYDEVWFGPKVSVMEVPYPALIGPCDREEFLPEGFSDWFDRSGFVLGIGDGHEGLSLVATEEIYRLPLSVPE